MARPARFGWTVPRPRFLLAALLVLAALALAGCGGLEAPPAAGIPPVGGAEAAPPGAPPGPPDLASWAGARSPRRVAVLPPPSSSESPVSGSLELEAGWNLVSFPVSQVTGVEPGAGVLGTGFAWDPSARSYLAVDLRDPAALSSGEGTGRGFWIYASQAARMDYTGWPNSGAHGDPDVTLDAGWNLLGLPFSEAQAFSTFQVQVPGGSLQPLPASVSTLVPPPGPEVLLFGSAFPYGGQAYQVLDLSVPSGLFQPGRACWVYAWQAGTLLRHAPPAAPRVRTTLLPEASVGQAYTATLEGEGGSPPCTWSLQEGLLPPGLSLGSDGSLAGTPGSEGSWFFTARLTDATGAAGEAEVSLVVGSTAHVLISEVLYNPPGTEANEEWVELYNPTAVPVDLSGWTLSDSTGAVQTGTLSLGQVLPAHGVFVWARSGSTFSTLYGWAPDQSGLPLSLGNTGESLSLRDRNGTLVDFVGFELPDWPVSATSTSLQRRGSQDSDTAADWEAAPGGGAAPGNPGAFPPGSPNRAPVADAGPDRVVHAGEPATLEGAGTADPDGDPLFLRWGPGLRGTRPTGTWELPGVYDLVLSACDGSLFGFDRATVFVLEPGAPVLGLVRSNDPPRAHRLDSDLVALIDGATTSVEGAFYEVGRLPVVEALVRARNRGLAVRLATESDNYAADPSGYAPLEAAGVPIYQGTTSGLTHDKFCVIDGEVVWTGSYNITDSDTVSNANDALALRSQTLAAAYSSEFAEFAAGRFGTRKTNAPPSEHLVEGRRVQAFFAPDGVRQPILDALASAQVSVDFAIFTFTDPAIRDAILERARAGVQVRGVMDAAQAGSVYSAWNLLSVEPGVLVRKDDFPGFLHHKFLVVDAGTDSDPLVVTGSYNWTASAEDSNDENAVLIHDSGIALQYRHLFERRFFSP